MAATVNEAMTGIKEIQALSLEDIFAREVLQRSQDTQKENVQTSRLMASLERTVDVLIAIATALVLWFGGRLILADVITPGDLLVFLAYLKKAYRPLQDYAKYTGRLAKAAAAGERVLEILQQT